MKKQTSPLAPRRQRDYAGVLSSILAILAGLLVGLIVLLATNPSNAFPAFSALITGGFYSGMKTFGNVLYYAVPIIMTGLGSASASRQASSTSAAPASSSWAPSAASILPASGISPEHSDGSFRCWPA